MFLLLARPLLAQTTLSTAPPSPGQAKAPFAYDHIVIVLEENKNYEQIINNGWTPHISSVLCKEGAILTKMYGEEHYSEGNYFWLLSGSNHGVGFRTQCRCTRSAHRTWPNN
jgi:hypothetical protein